MLLPSFGPGCVGGIGGSWRVAGFGSSAWRWAGQAEVSELGSGPSRRGRGLLGEIHPWTRVRDDSLGIRFSLKLAARTDKYARGMDTARPHCLCSNELKIFGPLFL